MADHCEHWSSKTGYAQASHYAACPWCEIKRLTQANTEYRDLTQLWQTRYFESLLELRKINKGAQRLRRKLDNANRKLRRAGRPLEEREAPHCPSCSCGMPVPQQSEPDPEANRVLYENLSKLQRR